MRTFKGEMRGEGIREGIMEGSGEEREEDTILSVKLS